MAEQLNEPKVSYRSKIAAWRNTVTPKGIVAVSFVIWVIFLITMILLKGTEIGAPVTEQAALTAANERLLQMVQWTIGVVLTLGGGLIGLNWYQSEKRYEHDRRIFEEKVNSDVDRKLSEYKTNLDMLSRASILSLDLVTAQMMKQTLGPPDGSVNDLGYLNRVIEAFYRQKEPLTRRAIATLLFEQLTQAVTIPPGKPGQPTDDQVRQIREIAHDLIGDSPDKTAQLELALGAYEASRVGSVSAPNLNERPAT